VNGRRLGGSTGLDDDDDDWPGYLQPTNAGSIHRLPLSVKPSKDARRHASCIPHGQIRALDQSVCAFEDFGPSIRPGPNETGRTAEN
jgi:hypothetical protein